MEETKAETIQEEQIQEMLSNFDWILKISTYRQRNI